MLLIKAQYSASLAHCPSSRCSIFEIDPITILNIDFLPIEYCFDRGFSDFESLTLLLLVLLNVYINDSKLVKRLSSRVFSGKVDLNIFLRLSYYCSVIRMEIMTGLLNIFSLTVFLLPASRSSSGNIGSVSTLFLWIQCHTYLIALLPKFSSLDLEMSLTSVKPTIALRSILDGKLSWINKGSSTSYLVVMSSRSQWPSLSA